MKILLVYPRDLAENYIATRPVMGLGYVATALHRDNHIVEILDMRIKRARFEKKLKKFKPDFVGFTLIALGLEQAYKLIEITKKNSNAKIIVGGPEVSLLPKKFIKHKHIDFIIAGEGDISFPEFIRKYSAGEDYSKVAGLGYQVNNKIIFNASKLIQDLDSLPFPEWDLFELKDYKKDTSKIKFPILSSRGCPYSCKFCDSTKINGLYRVRSPKSVVDEIEKVQRKFKNKNFQFLDDNFPIYPERVEGICDEILNRNLKVTWVVGQGFSPSRASYKLFKKMKEAGCIVIYFGIESADDEILRAIRKPHTMAQARKAIIDAKKAGLIVKAPFISGLPKSTYEKEKKYIDFFKETGIDMPKMGHLVPFPGTDMYDWVKKHARPIVPLEKMHEEVSQTRGSLDTDLFKPSFDTEEYPYEERIKLHKEFQNESEKYVLQKQFGKFLGLLAFKISRIRAIRRLGVKFLDIYYEQF